MTGGSLLLSDDFILVSRAVVGFNHDLVLLDLPVQLGQ